MRGFLMTRLLDNVLMFPLEKIKERSLWNAAVKDAGLEKWKTKV
jgi:hypothetical protein